ncbi:MAG: hypothetical protein FWG15_04980 [Propionibacteriaceae bacterium]|nr:hypothetical protein [Propionibacteriaceae bacterium]
MSRTSRWSAWRTLPRTAWSRISEAFHNFSTGLWQSGRPVWVLAIVASIGLVAGFALSGLVRSPADVNTGQGTAEGLITAKVEARQITATVVGRAEIAFADLVYVEPSTPEGALSAIVTGAVPAVGSQLKAGSVVLEVSGRPVFVLPGNFGAYRSLGPDSHGPDVAQLRAALNGLGLNAGTPGNQEYDAALADAVRSLYTKAGYAPPGSQDSSLSSAVRGARDALTEANEQLDQAKKDLASAKADLKSAKTQLSKASDATERAMAQEAVKTAQGMVDGCETQVTSASRGVSRAQESLAETQKAAWTPMPVGEVVFVHDLPRRVDQVSVKIGDDLNANTDEETPAPVVLSGAEIEVVARVNSAEAELLEVGGPAVMSVTGVGDITGKIVSICGAGGGGERSGESSGDLQFCSVDIALDDIGHISAADLVGNFQVTMTVGTSSQDSLVVPVAAVSADTAGKARITVVEGELVTGVGAKDQATTTVMVDVGISAEGMVEITHSDLELHPGDLVVIGQGVARAATTGEPEGGR